MKKLSAIIACYNDEQAIPIMAQRLTQVFRNLAVDYEMIFVNDGSPDRSQDVLESLASRDAHVKAITHSRNFGSQSAFTSGMLRATGDACILLDGDLQDPPELIGKFYAKWNLGYEVVYGIRSKREMPWLSEIIRRGFYRVFKNMSYVSMPLDSGDFSLIDRRVMNVLNQLPERDRFIRGLRAWAGFRQTGVEYVRPKRMFGASTNNFWRNIQWAKKGIFSFSYVPLEFISVLAGIVALLAVIAIFVQILGRILHPEIPHGVSTIIVLGLFLGAVQLFSIAVVAEYVGRIFEETKHRPGFVVSKLVGFENVIAGSAGPGKETWPRSPLDRSPSH
jgi:dolichol-phosphate mannosyltransferase